MATFELDPRLAADTLPLADLPLCRALLMNDARYPWVVLVPRVASVSEVFELSQEDQTKLWQEATQLGAAMKEAFHGDKLNIATLGNVVSQLHIHLVVRYTDDASWPAPVWGNGTPTPYELAQQGERREQLLAQIAGLTLSS
ncbi:HIT domain-containing protein [Vreelandella lutescens]|uniref:Histidine triad (HIT) protein n=1 Tax=Vreelandella lutescens TaxID=1602943 RepID=A0ABQ1NZM6_9GAMM|nr:HIT family protein [Halomonas lutescens]GGC86163.1 histidine triad (HIT) protein [Halomonas lutescens]